MGEDEHAFFAIGQRVAIVGIDHLWIEMIFPNMAASTSLDTFLRNSRANNLTQSVNIGSDDSKTGFDIGANNFCPGFRAKQTVFQADLLWSNTACFELITEGLCIEWCPPNTPCLQIDDQS